MVMEAEKSHEVLSACCGTRKANSAGPGAKEPQELGSDGISLGLSTKA